MATEHAADAPARRPRRPSTRRRRILWVALLLLVMLLALGVVMALQARAAYSHLRSAEDLAAGLRQQVMEGDEQRLVTSAEEIGRHTTQAREALSGPHWAAAAPLPLVGSDVAAVRTITEVADELATGALTPLVRAAELVEPEHLQPRGGRFALRPIRAVSPYFGSAARTSEAARARLDAVDHDDLAAPLRERYVEIATKVQSLSAAMDAVAGTTRVLPGLLGGDGPRRYLVLLQNNSEPRTLGGIAGSVVELRAAAGRIELVDQRAGGSLGHTTDPVLPLTRVERDLFGTQLGTFMQNVTSTPDFTRTAELARAHWERATGRQVDGVASLDPVALDELLSATGPVTLPDGSQLRPGKAAELLLNQVYFDIEDPQQQDAFFGRTASAVFEHVVGGNLDLPATVDALSTATTRGRFLFSSRHEDERDELAGTLLSGPLADRQQPTIGVFLHDRTQSKMGYYQRMRVRATPLSCRPGDGRVDVRVKLSSTAPEGRRSLPEYVTGNGAVVPRGHIASQVYLYAPEGAEITSFVSSRGPKRAMLRRHLGRQVTSWPVELAPGDSVRLHYRIEQAPTPLDELQVRVTPGPGKIQFPSFALPCGD